MMYTLFMLTSRLHGWEFTKNSIKFFLIMLQAYNPANTVNSIAFLAHLSL